MPKDRILKGFYFANSVTKEIEWISERTADATTLMNTFCGVGRYVSASSREGLTIDSWDPQVLGGCMIEGVFNKTTLETNVDKPRALKGYAFDTRFMVGQDDQSAGFMDWVGKNGTQADKFAMVTAAASMGYRGRLGTWEATFDMFWNKFVKNREKLEAFLDMPGTLRFHEGDVFEWDLEAMEYDAMILDPPVIKTTDTYSSSPIYAHLNRVIGGTKEMSRWDLPLFFQRIRRLLQMNVGTFLVKYQSMVQPTVEIFKGVLEEYGTIVEEEVWHKTSDASYAWVLRK